uniref:DNA mismatch repair protein MSH3 n=1 Tax=Daucus carota subsp. sativus TaxID=79200 RepID=A0A166A0D6_DAUCS
MGKQKQQVISRFFAPNPKTPSNPTPSSPPPPPKISTTVNFSPAKRALNSQFISSTKPPKTPKLSPHTHNPIPSLHQRFVEKLLEPSQDLLEPSGESSLVGPSVKYTPLEQQVVELKRKYPDVLLMIEVGYKFRFFGQDAENAARVLGIYAHMDHNFLTASVPTFRLNVYVRRLVGAGYKVGVVKQTETAAIKAHGSNRLGPFCRGLSALYTKATLEAAEDVGGGEEGFGSCSNYLVCVVENVDIGGIESGCDSKIGIIAVEISTGDVIYGEFDDNFMRSALEALLLRLSPAELLLAEPLSKQTEKLLSSYAGPTSNVRVEHISRDSFNQGSALAEVMALSDNKSDSQLVKNLHKETEVETEAADCSTNEGIVDMPDMVVQALALTIRHLKQFGFEKILCSGASFRPLSGSMEMTLSANAMQQLEILRNNIDGSESGSLLQCMNNTLTISGSRILRHWVTHPLCDRNMIHSRLDAVSEIAESMGSYKASQSINCDEEDSNVTIVCPKLHQVLSSVLTFLGRSPDIQRGITRIFHRTATTSEFIAIIKAILVAGKQLHELHVEEEGRNTIVGKNIVHSVLLRKLVLTASSSRLIGIAAKLLSSLNKDAAEKQDLQNLFISTDGQFSEVGEARTKVQCAKEKLDLLINSYRKQLGKRNLEFTSVLGTTHLIELPADVKVPSNWVKVNSTKKTIRYHPPEVSTALDQLSLVTEELTHICRAAWDNFLKEFGRYYSEFQAAVEALASLDCLHSLAVLSRNKGYVRPVFVNDNDPVQISVRSGRHPVGSFVPACSASLHVLDGIYTRMGSSDSIQQGRSTFLEELSEASNILHSCSPRSLVIIDELGRGTSTHDGVAIAYATLQYLLEEKRCMTLFVTHYPKIVDIKTQFPRAVGAYHVSYLTSKKDPSTDRNNDQRVDTMNYEDVLYLYKLVPGVSKSSFGFKVAQLAQVRCTVCFYQLNQFVTLKICLQVELPASCISQAISMAVKLEAAVSNRRKNRLACNHSNESASPDNEAKHAPKRLTEHIEDTCAEETEDLEELCTVFREIFLNINLASSVDGDLEKCFQLLNHARGLALELINR